MNYEWLDSEFTLKMVKYLIDECDYRADTYNEWMRDGFRLATLGERGYELFLHLSKKSKGFKSEEEVRKKFDNFVKSEKAGKKVLLHYRSEAKKRIGEGWVKIIEGL